MMLGLVLPVGWNGIVFFNIVILFGPSIFGIIMNKDRGIPGPIKGMRSTMKALGGFIEQQVTTFQNHLVGTTFVIFNPNK